MLPPDQLLTSRIHKPHGEPVKAMAPIPFRRQTPWEVACEAVRLGALIFAFFFSPIWTTRRRQRQDRCACGNLAHQAALPLEKVCALIP